jgi:hypothetical protein
MNYTRSPASDFDDWGVDGWESKNLIPLMKKVLSHAAIVCIFVKLNCCYCIAGDIRGAGRSSNPRLQWTYQGVLWWK